MWKKICLAVVASSLSTLTLMWLYKKTRQPQKVISSISTYFIYHELPNNLVAQFSEIKITDEEVVDPTLKEYLTEKDALVSQKASLFELNAISSKIFRHQLALIKKKISDQYILSLAKQQNKTTQEYLNEILQKKEVSLSPEELTNELQQLGITEKEESFKKIKKILENKKKQRLIDEEIEQTFLKTPILTNLKPPYFEMDIKKDWTPHWGAEDSPITLVAFVDFTKQSSQILNKSLIQLAKKYPEVQFLWRPYFLDKEDPLQKLIAEALICLWHQKQDTFFYVLYTLDYVQHDSTEQNLYQLAKQKLASLDELKKCVVQHKYQSVIDYHLKYGSYLGITSTPSLFLNGEVIEGEFRESVIEEYLKSYLYTK